MICADFGDWRNLRADGIIDRDSPSGDGRVVRIGLGWLLHRKSNGPLENRSSPAPPGLYAALAKLIGEGQRAQKARNWAAAAACYSEALARDAERWGSNDDVMSPRQRAIVSVQLGHTLREQGETADAEKAFREAIELDATLDEAHYFLGLLMQRSARRAEAASTYFNGLQLTGSALLRRGLEELDYSFAEIDEALARGGLPQVRSIPDDPDFPPRPIEGLLGRIKSYHWFHSINLGEGIVTPGIKTRIEISREADAIFGPISLHNRSVVDIGAWNGCFTVEAKRRGANRILAIDADAWVDPGVRGKETFDLVMSRLGIDVETQLIDIQTASADTIGHWQVALFLGVFYHLFDPIAALKCLAAITEEVLVLETHLELQDVEKPAMAFYPGSELSGDASNWWAPNRAAVEALLKTVGFPRVVFTPHPAGPNVRGIFHAFKSEAAYQEHQAAVTVDEPARA